LAMAITSLVIGAINLGLKTWLVLVPLFRSGRELAGPPGLALFNFGVSSVALVIILTLLTLGIMWSEYILYTLYLRALAMQQKDRWLEQDCYRVLFFACGVAGAQVLISLISLLILQNATPSKGVAYLILFLQLIANGVVTAFGVLYMRYIQVLRSQVD
jgi:predicted permease